VPKVLIVDDSETIRTVIKIHLIGHDVEFLEATNGDDGLRLATHHHPNVMIVDLKMPGMDGLTFLRTVRKMGRFHTTPVILLTSDKREETKRSALDAGATWFMTKPFDGHELADRILKGI
jgi:DNA-binding response OmpR family regulator